MGAAPVAHPRNSFMMGMAHTIPVPAGRPPFLVPMTDASLPPSQGSVHVAVKEGVPVSPWWRQAKVRSGAHKDEDDDDDDDRDAFLGAVSTLCEGLLPIQSSIRVEQAPDTGGHRLWVALAFPRGAVLAACAEGLPCCTPMLTVVVMDWSRGGDVVLRLSRPPQSGGDYRVLRGMVSAAGALATRDMSPQLAFYSAVQGQRVPTLTTALPLLKSMNTGRHACLLAGAFTECFVGAMLCRAADHAAEFPTAVAMSALGVLLPLPVTSFLGRGPRAGTERCWHLLATLQQMADADPVPSMVYAYTALFLGNLWAVLQDPETGPTGPTTVPNPKIQDRLVLQLQTTALTVWRNARSDLKAYRDEGVLNRNAAMAELQLTLDLLEPIRAAIPATLLAELNRAALAETAAATAAAKAAAAKAAAAAAPLYPSTGNMHGFGNNYMWWRKKDTHQHQHPSHKSWRRRCREKYGEAYCALGPTEGPDEEHLFRTPSPVRGESPVVDLTTSPVHMPHFWAGEA